MQGLARKDVVFGAARVYTVTVPGPKWKSWLGSMSSHWYHKTPIQAALLTGLLGLIPLTVNFISTTTSPRNPSYASLAVLPFEYAGLDTDVHYLSEGIREGLTKRLSKLAGLRTTPSTMASQFQGDGLDEAALKLAVDVLVTGTLLLKEHET